MMIRNDTSLLLVVGGTANTQCSKQWYTNDDDDDDTTNDRDAGAVYRQHNRNVKIIININRRLNMMK